MAFGVLVAIVIAAASLARVILWGNPYPAEVQRYWTAGGLLAVVLAFAATTLGPRVDSFTNSIRRAVERPSDFAFSVLVAVVVFATVLFIVFYCFDGRPLTSDEASQYWESRIMLHGRLSLPRDPNAEFFSLDTVVDVERWYSQFPIGGSLLLAIGTLLGSPWIVNPAIAALTCIAFYDFSRRSFGRLEGRVATILLAAGPMFLLMSGTWMNHVPTLFWGVLSLAALVRWDQASSRKTRMIGAAVLGFSIGAMATIRPLDALVFATCIGLFQLYQVFSAQPAQRRVLAASIALQIACALACVGILLIANLSTTGRALTFGYDVAWGPGHRVGFHLDPYGHVHSVSEGLNYALSYFGELNMHLLAWPIPAAVFLLIAALVWHRVTKWSVLLLALIAGQVGAYGAYWYRGELFGPRFLFSVIPAFIVLIALVPFDVARFRRDRPRRFITILICLCITIAWLAPRSFLGVPGLISRARSTRASLKIDPARVARDAGVTRGLIFLHEPLGSRLLRRMWGLGVPRPQAAQLLASKDACSLLATIASAEQSPARDRDVGQIMSRSRDFVPTQANVRVTDRTVHINDANSVTPECAQEISSDQQWSTVPFGSGLMLEPIDSDGRIRGDLIYVADLGAHNAVLSSRFGDRPWYRLGWTRDADGSVTGRLMPY